MNLRPKTSTLVVLVFAGLSLLTFVVIGLGAYTRLMDAGLGCPDWPGCFGQFLWPSEAQEIIRAEEGFPEIAVETGKARIEMVHRYAAASIGVLLLLLLGGLYRTDAPQVLRRLLWLILALVILQGLFGMWTVTLKLWPQIVVLHLLGGVIILATIWYGLLMAGWQGQHPSTSELPTLLLSRLAQLAVPLVLVQIALGGWVSANYAGLACPDFPKCQGRWWPDSNFIHGFNLLQPPGPDYSGGLLDAAPRTAIHMAHRVFALILSVYLAVLIWHAWQCTWRNIRILATVIGFVLVCQILLGVINVLSGLPVILGVLHNLIAVCLLLAVLSLAWLCYRALSSTTQSSDEPLI